jgi:hypothetical protein
VSSHNKINLQNAFTRHCVGNAPFVVCQIPSYIVFSRIHSYVPLLNILMLKNVFSFLCSSSAGLTLQKQVVHYKPDICFGQCSFRLCLIHPPNLFVQPTLLASIAELGDAIIVFLSSMHCLNFACVQKNCLFSFTHCMSNVHVFSIYIYYRHCVFRYFSF